MQQRSGEWELALEQQSDLSVTQGSTAAVADSVRRGADLRVYMTTEKYEETIYFQQTYAATGEDFAGLMSHHHGYVHHGQQVEQPNCSIFRYDASGTFAQMKWLWGDVAVDESQSYGYGVYRWFVSDRWRLVYEHDEAGCPMTGDLEELKGLVREGRTLQVGIRQLFGLVDDRTDGPDHISYVSTMQPVIRDDHVESNCDLVVIGAPTWPITWKDGLHISTMLPSTTGQIICFAAEPGNLPFTHLVRRRGMCWMVAERG